MEEVNIIRGTESLEEVEFMTSKDVCAYCGFSVVVLDRLEREGKLKPARKFVTNRRRLYKLEDVEKFLDTIRTTKE